MVPSRTLSRLLAGALTCAAASAVVAPPSAQAAPPAPETVTFQHTGAAQQWTVPDGVVNATFDLFGAQGAGEGNGGLGGRATATVPVTPGDVVTILVGGEGTHPGFEGRLGFNGGGNGWHSGGGATDVRIGGTDLDDRVLVAGGGGASTAGCKGGHGGLPGVVGELSEGCSGTPGGGATGDAGGVNAADATLNGTLGQGGSNASTQGGGGGGGWYGGAASASAGGGGGSSHGPADSVFETGVRTGSGQATVTFLPSAELTVTRAGTGAGTVTSTPAGIDCGTSCAAWFDLGSDVTLEATPDASSTFSGWSGACSGTDACTIAMDQAQAVTATFAAKPAVTVPSTPSNPTPTATPPTTPAAPATPATPARDRKPVLRDLEVKRGNVHGGRSEATLHFGVSEAVELSVRLRQMCGKKICGSYHQLPAEADAGRASYQFRGSVKPTRLSPGRYRVTLVAQDSAGQRDRKRVHFTIQG